MNAGAGGAIPLVVIAGGVLVNFLFQQRLSSQYDYHCERCGEMFSLSPAVGAVAPHRFGESKWTRCPTGGRFTWASPVLKQ